MELMNSVVPIPRYAGFKKCTVSALVKSQTPVPLRILIDRDLIGAVMGCRKVTIGQVENVTRTRIFLDGTQRKINKNILEIGLAIEGKPSNCSNACRRILEIMQKKQKQLCRNRSVKLKILMPRCYMGRIIGKECDIIRTIMSQTETKIILSDVYDKSIPDRIITIDGSIDKMCNAEIQISMILRRSFTNDPHSMAPQYNINQELPMMNPTDVNYSGDTFHSYQAFRPAQYLHPHSNGSYQFRAPFIQPQTIINPEFHAIVPINTNYSVIAFQINQQSNLPVQMFSVYSEVTNTFMDNVYNNRQAQTTISNQGLHMMNSTGIIYSPPVFERDHQPFSSAQYLSSNSKVTNTFMDSNVYNNYEVQTTISNQGLHMMNSTDIIYSPPVFQRDHHSFSSAQNLSSYSKVTNTFMDNNAYNNYEAQTSISNQELHMMNSTGINYSVPVLDHQQFLSAPYLSSYSEVTNTFMDNNVYNYQTQNTILNQRLHTMDSTNINYSAPAFQIDQPFIPTQQCLPSYSNVTNQILDADFNDALESVYLFIPLDSVKALVGILGSNINEIVDISGANVHILPEKVENPIAPRQFCQKVIVSGNRKAQWEAQQMIFETMWKEGYGPAFEEVILTVEISLPHNQVRTLIDHGRSLMRRMEKEMGCIIREPKNKTTYYTTCSQLHVIGGFIGTQLVQKSIRSILNT